MGAEEVVRQWVDLYNDVEPGTYGSDRVFDLYAPDVQWRETPTPLTPEGRSGGLDALRESMALSASLFVDRAVVLREVIVEGERAAMRFTWSATAKVDLGRVAPAGGHVTVECATFLRVADGKIVEITEMLGPPT